MTKRAKEHQLLVWNQKRAKRGWNEVQSWWPCIRIRRGYFPKKYYRPKITIQYAINYDKLMNKHGIVWTGKGYRSCITGREI